MRKFRNAILATLAIASAAGAAVAAETHVMKVALPDGSVANVRYEGKVPPQIRVVRRAPVTTLHFIPVRVAMPMTSSPFAMMDRMMADMDRQMDVMMRQAAAMQAQAPAARPRGPVALVSAGNAPAGSSFSYRFVSINNGKTTCTQSVQVTSQGANAQPKVVKASSGDCAAVNTNARPGTVSAPVTAKPPVADPKVRPDRTI